MSELTLGRVESAKIFFEEQLQNRLECDKELAKQDDPNGTVRPIYMGRLVEPYYRTILAILTDYEAALPLLEKPAPKVEPEGDSSGHPQAEERREMVALLDEWSPGDIRPGKPEIWAKVRALILSPPKASVTREQVEQFIPCVCIDAYKDRCLAQPDCPRCSLVDVDGLLAYLNFGIRVVEPSEAAEVEPEGGGG